ARPHSSNSISDVIVEMASHILCPPLYRCISISTHGRVESDIRLVDHNPRRRKVAVALRSSVGPLEDRGICRNVTGAEYSPLLSAQMTPPQSASVASSAPVPHACPPAAAATGAHTVA